MASTSPKETPHFFDTWVFSKTVEFLELNGMERKDWEYAEEVDGWDKFMRNEISKDQIPVRLRHYEGQETTSARPYMLYIDNESTEWDSWIIKFFPSAKKAKKFCKKRNLNFVKK